MTNKQQLHVTTIVTDKKGQQHVSTWQEEGIIEEIRSAYKSDGWIVGADGDYLICTAREGYYDTVHIFSPLPVADNYCDDRR